jgi:hypothetical protein
MLFVKIDFKKVLTKCYGLSSFFTQISKTNRTNSCNPKGSNIDIDMKRDEMMQTI